MTRTQGKVALVGAGPGDPGLMTVRGLAALRAADVVVYDRLVEPRLLDHASPSAERIFAGKSLRANPKRQEEINALLIKLAREGKRVVRLKGGDPFVFGRGGEEAMALAAEGIPYDVVPGVTSAIAVPAYAGIPVTDRGVSSSFAVITGREDAGKEWSRVAWAKLAGRAGTLVILMSVETLESTIDQLRKHGVPEETPVAVIQHGTLPSQRTVQGTLSDIAQRARHAGLGPPAVTVVGHVVSLRDRIKWFEERPLFGKRVMVTRSRQQASVLVRLLEEAGAVCLEVPTIAIGPPTVWGPLDDALRNCRTFDWVVFASGNAVDWTFHRLNTLGLDARVLFGQRIAAIGVATADLLLRHGVRADFKPATATSEDLTAELGRVGIGGARMLLPQSSIAPDDLARGLASHGALVTVADAYDTSIPEGSPELALQALTESGVDVVTFTSSSTVENLVRLLGPDAQRLINRTLTACVGPTTARKAESMGLRVGVTAAERTMPGLVDAIITAVEAHREA